MISGSWFVILLSALLVNVAFFLPDIAGIMIIPGVLLFPFVLEARYGCLAWTILTLMPHFSWVFFLLHNRSSASMGISALLYCVVISYFIAGFTLWFLLTRVASKSMRRVWRYSLVLVSFGCYHIIIATCGLTLLVGYREGYPFLNPLIPLAHVIMKAAGWERSETMIPADCHLGLPVILNLIQDGIQKNTISLHYLKPITSTYSPEGDGQEIFHMLAQRRTEVQNAGIIVAPESFFSYPINCYPHLIGLWSCALPPQSLFIFGTQWLEAGKLYQALCGLQNNHIVFVYKKKHLIGFVERMPPWYAKKPMLRSLFLDQVQEFTLYIGEHPTIFLADKRIAFSLCSEFFFTEWRNNCDVIFFLVNDGWFVDYFRKIMDNLACIKSVYLQIPLLYVGHNHCKLVTRKDLHECIHA